MYTKVFGGETITDFNSVLHIYSKIKLPFSTVFLFNNHFQSSTNITTFYFKLVHNLGC